jgi:hypothetical protein
LIPTRNDVLRLRWSIALLVLAILVGVIVVLLARQIAGEAAAIVGRLTVQAGQIRSRLNGFDNEEAEVRDGIAAFQRYSAQNMIGPEDRRQWLTQIGQIGSRRHLLATRYELQPQGAVSPESMPGDETGTGYQFMSSTMKLQIDLLHEDDLLELLADLRRSVRAHLLVRDCSIERLPKATIADASPAQLQANCVIDWITLREMP